MKKDGMFNFKSMDWSVLFMLTAVIFAACEPTMGTQPQGKTLEATVAGDSLHITNFSTAPVHYYITPKAEASADSSASAHTISSLRTVSFNFADISLHPSTDDLTIFYWSDPNTAQSARSHPIQRR